MKLGAVFPQTEIGADPGAVKAFAQAAESLGYDYVLAYDHVLGADTANRPDWRGGYRLEHAFHEPFVLFSYLAGVTERIGLATGVVILPQRQTALVAKQAAALDVLSGGRLRLGVGIGWNAVEYEALGQDFHNRGRRYEEQIAVLRLLWTQESVAFQGRWHSVPEAGINPLPVQRPIPIWMGGASGMGDDDRVLRRIARLADGWILNQRADGAAPRRRSPLPRNRARGGARPRLRRHRWPRPPRQRQRHRPSRPRPRVVGRPPRRLRSPQHDERRPGHARRPHRRAAAIQGGGGVGGQRALDAIPGA